MKTRIGLFFGGASPEHDVSIRSAKEIYQAFDKEKYDILPIKIDFDGKWYLLSERTFLEHSSHKDYSFDLATSNQRIYSFDVLQNQIDVAFPIIHGRFGEDGCIQGVFELLSIPYVGPDVLASSLSMDKALSKQVISAAGIHTARCVSYHIWEEVDQSRFADYAYPLFVKPSKTGSSIGITRVDTEQEIDEAINYAFSFDDKIVIEEGVSGIEIEVSILGGKTPLVSVPGRIIPKSAYYSHENKIDPEGASFEIPLNVSPLITEKIQACALACYKALNCEGMARIDLFLKEDNEIVFNEANTLPGFTQSSLFPILFKATGISYDRLLDALVEHAFERSERRRLFQTKVEASHATVQ